MSNHATAATIAPTDSGRGSPVSVRASRSPARPRWRRPNLTWLIAWRIFVHDGVRLAVTVAGIGFSTVLMGMQLGILLNFIHTTSMIVDHAGTDLWVIAHGVKAVDLATPLEERRRFQALAVEGVAKAEPLLMQFGFWKREDGVRENVIVVGVDRDATMGMPWTAMTGRSVSDALAIPDGVIIDRLYADRLQVHDLDQRAEIDNHRACVPAFTEGIRPRKVCAPTRPPTALQPFSPLRKACRIVSIPLGVS
jgi:putative ABC transport system permease protein